jgi:hypothetical protein
MQRQIDPIQASLAAICTFIENSQRSPSRSEVFIAAMKQSPPTIDGSPDGVQASTRAVRMPGARAGESQCHLLAGSCARNRAFTTRRPTTTAAAAAGLQCHEFELGDRGVFFALVP